MKLTGKQQNNVKYLTIIKSFEEFNSNQNISVLILNFAQLVTEWAHLKLIARKIFSCNTNTAMN